MRIYEELFIVKPDATEEEVDQLIEHYESKGRLRAALNLLHALERASTRILANPAMGLEAPRPYPDLKVHGRRWIVEGRYWISYSLIDLPVISGVFYVEADIPRCI